jgi:hypothetical protein
MSVWNHLAELGGLPVHLFLDPDDLEALDALDDSGEPEDGEDGSGGGYPPEVWRAAGAAPPRSPCRARPGTSTCGA